MKQRPLVASFVLFIVLCMSAAYWAMQLFKPPLRAVTAPPQVARAEPRLDAAAGLFGGRPAGTAVAGNYQLKGVVVAGNGKESVAILAANGKPAQAIGINGTVAPGVTVKEVHPGYVLVSEDGVTKRVELPESAKSLAATGSAAGNSAAPVATAPALPPRMAPPMSGGVNLPAQTPALPAQPAQAPVPAPAMSSGVSTTTPPQSAYPAQSTSGTGNPPAPANSVIPGGGHSGVR